MIGAAMNPDVAGVVGADRGLDARAVEHVALNEPLEVRGGDQHDVDDVLLDHRLDGIEEFGAGFKAR